MKLQIKKLDLSKLQVQQNSPYTSQYQQKGTAKSQRQAQEFTCLTDRQKDLPFNKNNEAAIISNVKQDNLDSIKNIKKQFQYIISSQQQTKLSVEMKNQMLLGMRQQLKEQIHLCQSMGQVKKAFKQELKLTRNGVKDQLESSRKASCIIQDIYSIYIQCVNKSYDSRIPKHSQSIASRSRGNSPQKSISFQQSVGQNSSRSRRTQVLQENKPVSILSIIAEIQNDNSKMKESISVLKNQSIELNESIDNIKIELSHFKINLHELEQILEEKLQYEEELQVLNQFLQQKKRQDPSNFEQTFKVILNQLQDDDSEDE